MIATHVSVLRGPPAQCHGPGQVTPSPSLSFCSVTGAGTQCQHQGPGTISPTAKAPQGEREGGQDEGQGATHQPVLEVDRDEGSP